MVSREDNTGLCCSMMNFLPAKKKETKKNSNSDKKLSSLECRAGDQDEVLADCPNC